MSYINFLALVRYGREAMFRFVKILATSDIHSPHFLPLFIASLSQVPFNEIELVILAGDLVDKGRIEMLKPVIEVLKKHLQNNDVPIVAVFGNEEYMDRENAFIERYPEIHWVSDSVLRLQLRSGIDICIVGSRGVLLRPTKWQSKHIPSIHEIYRERLKRLRELLRVCRDSCQFVVLVTHYASSFVTVNGEPPSIHQYLGYPLIEHLGENEKPHLAIHGHAHNSKVLHAVVNGVPVYNVALPARKGVTLIELSIPTPS